MATPVRIGSKPARSVTVRRIPVQSLPAWVLEVGVNCVDAKATPASDSACEAVGQSVVDPRRADHFERRVGPATDRNVGPFHQRDPGVEHGLGDRSQVGRRRRPDEPRLVEIGGPPPAPHAHDFELCAEMLVGVDHLGELAERHAVANGERMVIDEGHVARGRERTGHVDAVDGIRTIEDHDAQPALGRDGEGSVHGGGVGVETGADVLDVEHQRIDAGQHLVARRKAIAVEAVDGQARTFVAAVFDPLVEIGEKAMLGSEESDQRSRPARSCKTSTVRAPSPSRPLALVMRPTLAPAQASKVLALQDVDPDFDARRRRAVSARCARRDRGLRVTHRAATDGRASRRERCKGRDRRRHETTDFARRRWCRCDR